VVTRTPSDKFFEIFSQVSRLVDLEYSQAQKELTSFISKAKTVMGELDASYIKEVEDMLAKSFNVVVEDVIQVDIRAQVQEYGDLAEVNIQDKEYGDNDSVTLRYRGYYGPQGTEQSLKGFRHIISQLRKKSDDLTPLWKKLASDWFRSNKKEVFSQMGPGQRPDFEDLTLTTKLRKEKQSKRGLAGGIYPILVASGALMYSLTKMDKALGAIFNFSSKSMELGSSHPVVKYHREGRSGGNNPLPIRNPVRVGSPERIARWSRTARQYMTLINVRGAA
jgi:hypothetical protein